MTGPTVPYFAEAQTATVTIDGITYRVPLLDADSRLYATPCAVGASEVKVVRETTAGDSTTRATLLTPTAGKKVRVVGYQMNTTTATGTRFELYFGTGANIGTNAGKEIANPLLDADTLPTFGLVFPDGGGPVGDADEVVSMRTIADISTQGTFMLYYREE